VFVLSFFLRFNCHFIDVRLTRLLNITYLLTYLLIYLLTYFLFSLSLSLFSSSFPPYLMLQNVGDDPSERKTFCYESTVLFIVLKETC